ncbi:MAG: VIT1/CCC1 transporter family protein [Chloroflexota bacterium]
MALAESAGEPLRQRPETLFRERQRIANLSRIREFVFGTQDGLLTTLGVVTSVVGATSNSATVIVAGLAEAVAGALAMGVGEYQGSRAQQELHTVEIEKERTELQEKPAEEHRELRAIFQQEGLNRDSADAVAGLLAQHPELLFRTHVEKELGLRLEEFESPLRNALVMGASFFLGALLPIIPYLVAPARPALVASVVLTVLALFGVGLAKAAVTHRRWLRSGFEVMIFGVLAAAIAYALGVWLPHVFGR